jgi:hypothetical protein
MRKTSTKTWLRKHSSDKAKGFYLKSKAQLQAQYDVENVFYKFDDDCSGTLECEELFAMFEANGIEVTYSQIKKLFDIVDRSRTGMLNLEKFKKFTND